MQDAHRNRYKNVTNLAIQQKVWIVKLFLDYYSENILWGFTQTKIYLARDYIFQAFTSTSWVYGFINALLWRHNEPDGVSNHQPHDCLLNRLFGHRSKKTSKLRVTGVCVGNSPGTGEFPTQMASNAENVSIWWRHHGMVIVSITTWWMPYHTFCHNRVVDVALTQTRHTTFKESTTV